MKQIIILISLLFAFCYAQDINGVYLQKVGKDSLYQMYNGLNESLGVDVVPTDTNFTSVYIEIPDDLDLRIRFDAFVEMETKYSYDINVFEQEYTAMSFHGHHRRGDYLVAPMGKFLSGNDKEAAGKMNTTALKGYGYEMKLEDATVESPRNKFNCHIMGRWTIPVAPDSVIKYIIVNGTEIYYTNSIRILFVNSRYSLLLTINENKMENKHSESIEAKETLRDPDNDFKNLHRCKDGSFVSIDGNSRVFPKMSDSHLENTINLIADRIDEGKLPEEFILPYQEELNKRNKTGKKDSFYKKLYRMINNIPNELFDAR